MKELNTYMSFFKLLLKLFNLLNNIAPFHIPWKQKIFSGGLERDQLHEIG